MIPQRHSIYPAAVTLPFATHTPEPLIGSCASVGGDDFFPEAGGSSRDAKTVCAGCPVRERCLIEAMVRGDEFGIFGGLSVRERRRLAKSGWQPGDPLPEITGIAATCPDCGKRVGNVATHRWHKHAGAA